MKETKVYVDELPKCCEKCRFCYDNRPYWKSTDFFCLLDEDEIDKKVYKNCLLHNIQDHDKELVAKVCEDIKDRAYENVGYHICECGKKFDIECIDFEDLCEIIDKIQKEFEDE